jgi:glucokinase
VENDVRAAAVGAYRSGGQGAARNLAYVNVGTGVSAGLILEGKLYRGAHGMAGEIGHIITEPDGPLCNCGARGCLETLVAGPAIARMGQEAVEAGEDTVLQRAGTITAATVYEAAASGDGVALRITEQVGTTLGRALHALVMSYDVERIVLGGGVTGAGEVFLEAIRRAWARERAQSALARALLRPEMLHLTEQGRNMVAYGAGVLAAEAAGQVSASTGGSSFLTQTS